MVRCAAILWIVSITATACLAQDVTGSWRGTIKANVLPGPVFSSGVGGPRAGTRTVAPDSEIPIVLKLTKDRRGALTGTLFSADNVSSSFTLWAPSFDGSKLSFTVQELPFTGTLSGDHNSIAGWLHGAPLILSRVDRLESAPPPGATPAPEPSVDPSSLLARALEKLAGTTRRLLKYTCLETVERAYYSDPRAKSSANPLSESPASSCDKRQFGRGGNLFLDAEDRLRLEVAVSAGKEIHSWPSAGGFDGRSIYDMVSTGPILTGAFGTTVVDIFENQGTRYRFTGVNQDGGFEYEFEVAPEVSHYSVRAGLDWKITGYSGSFEIRAATAELARLIIETDPLPQETGMCRARTDTAYHYAQIGDGQFLVPLKSQFDTLPTNLGETRSRIAFSACHEFTAESSLVSDDQASPAASKPAPLPPAPLPRGLELTLALTTAIDGNTAAAGDLITAKVVHAVRAGVGSNEVLIPAGAVAHGRILQMRHQYKTATFELLIRFDALDRNGFVSPLAVRVDRDLKPAKGRTADGFATRGTEFSLPPPSGDPASWFTFAATGARYVMPAGSESKWITVAP
jgi:hypothetical protein